MTTRPTVLPPPAPEAPVRFVVIDDEPIYRTGLAKAPGHQLEQVGGWNSVDAFLALQREPFHVVVLDLCLNRQTGDPAVLQGVLAIQKLVDELGAPILVHTADPRPEPVARCVAAGASGYVSKYNGDQGVLAAAVDEIGRHGAIMNDALHRALRELVSRCRDVRLSKPLERTLNLLDQGRTDKQIAQELQLSARTVEDQKRKILEIFGADLEERTTFARLRYELGVGPGDIVNDAPPNQRLGRGLIAQALARLGVRQR